MRLCFAVTDTQWPAVSDTPGCADSPTATAVDSGTISGYAFGYTGTSVSSVGAICQQNV